MVLRNPIQILTLYTESIPEKKHSSGQEMGPCGIGNQRSAQKPKKIQKTITYFNGLSMLHICVQLVIVLSSIHFQDTILQGANVNSKDPAQSTPLMLAAKNNHLPVVEVGLHRYATTHRKTILPRTSSCCLHTSSVVFHFEPSLRATMKYSSLISVPNMISSSDNL